MKRAGVEVFEKVRTQLRSLHEEMAALAKKSPNDAINAFKLNFVNEVLLKCNKFLGQRYRPFPTFEEFASDDMPSNSDVTYPVSVYCVLRRTQSGEYLRALRDVVLEY